VSPPDVIVGWLQNDYGQLGRAGEAIAHVLAETDLGGSVAYVEPFLGREGAPAELNHRVDRSLHVFSGVGTPPSGHHEVAAAVVAGAGLTDPLLMNFGVSEANWWIQYEFAPLCRSSLLVTYDKLAEWPALAARAGLLERVRTRLITASDRACGLSLGSIDDVPDAVYVGHGCDETWHDPQIDFREEPADLSGIPHPRVVYVGAMSMRFDAGAIAALARTGVQVVLIGIAPQPDLLEVINAEEAVHFLGVRSPAQTPSYLLHCDVAIVPHTDEPFTRSMEPHKVYNYAAAGLRSVLQHASCPPALRDVVESTSDHQTFAEAVLRFVDAGRLDAEHTIAARALSWRRVTEAMLATVS
jgi:hypothetical protein